VRRALALGTAHLLNPAVEEDSGRTPLLWAEMAKHCRRGVLVGALLATCENGLEMYIGPESQGRLQLYI
jgi:hypothetical protein